MSQPFEVRRFRAGEAVVEVHDSPDSLGKAAALKAAQRINQSIARKGRARIIAATGNSQIPLVEAFTRQDINWSAVEVFHMDEYVGVSADHPASFRRWIRERIEAKVHPGHMHYLQGDAPDLDAEIMRYTALLKEAPIDLAFVGFGENGHIAFNDPHEANFDDPATVRIATLDEPCRLQQVGEGHFDGLSSVPRTALTITCPGLFMAESWVSSVPDSRKAKAVRCSLEGPVSTACPGSLAQRHPNTFVYLDAHSAALLSATSPAYS
jgi:glucosamine-6-phosphate deaminase